MIEVKEGSRWVGKDGKTFHVIHVIELNGNTWVHYEEDQCNECREYSCYIESFVERFSLVDNA